MTTLRTQEWKDNLKPRITMNKNWNAKGREITTHICITLILESHVSELQIETNCSVDDAPIIFSHLHYLCISWKALKNSDMNRTWTLTSAMLVQCFSSSAIKSTASWSLCGCQFERSVEGIEALPGTSNSMGLDYCAHKWFLCKTSSIIMLC